MEDMVNHPKHYEDGCSIECIHMMWTFLGLKGVIMFCLGNAYKYLWRHKLKNNPEEDLAKAKWYIDEAFWMLEDLNHEDEEEYAWVFPKLCELLRLHNLYSVRYQQYPAKNSISAEIEKELDKMDCSYDYEDLKKYLDEFSPLKLYGREEKEDENQKDWEQVYHDINTIFNNLPTECILDHDINIEIDRVIAICKKHCKTDS